MSQQSQQTHLVIVESPAKAKTINKVLGKNYTVLASYGHVRDLVPKEGAVDPDNDFAMQFEPVERNEKHINNIATALRKADTLLLATDPDREGEAISFDVAELMREMKILKDKPVQRIVFHEITKTAILHAAANPRDVDIDMVHAQRARRALDFLVGFTLSPLLWRKIRPGLSAGRVQSPALRLVVERELEIEAHKPREYWTIGADLIATKQAVAAKLTQYDSKKVEQFTVTTEKQATTIKKALVKAADGSVTVTKVDKKQRKRNPAAPFITSTIQQEASRKLGFGARRTMIVAQQLYEGIDVGDGTVGLISYMRTDSTTLSQDALSEIRGFIEKQYGKDNLPDAPRIYKTKSKNAQEAHEAIRPTSVLRKPDDIKKHLTKEQYDLYSLVWKRTVACQMIHATINTVAIDFSCGNGNTLRANGSIIAHSGFMAVYLEGLDDAKIDDSEGKLLPEMAVGDTVKLNDILTEQHFTEPPPRFSEATLVKALEEFGIGRPSTYASILHTIVARGYTILDKKRFKPTDVGRIVSQFLTNYFTKYVDYDFTAKLEDELDAVSRGEKEWVPLLKEFWTPFKALIDDTMKNVQRSDVTQEKMDEKCPECQHDLSIRLGRSGRFIGCTNYPECKYTRNLDTAEGEAQTPQIVEDRKCPKCKQDLVIKVGRYGKFIGCSSYPDCKHIEPLEKPLDTEIECPTCHKGTLLKRRSRRGTYFYSCSKYPTCKYAVWNEPLSENCPKCDWPVLTIKTTKRKGTEKVCPQKECDFTEPMPDADV